MKILNRIVENGNTIGYTIDAADTGTSVSGVNLTLPMCERALYIETYISALTQAGYKYYGYKADDIEAPDGTPISQLPAINRSDVDDMEWFASVDMADTAAMSDVDASKYYSFKEKQLIEFRKEDSYEINTREELVAYLVKTKMVYYNLNYTDDNRPLNSFVNPDALFTIEEIAESPEIKSYFEVIIKRHHFRNYQAYKELIGWLCEKGVLNTDKPTMGEFLAAYYAWGPEGIKGKCTKTEVKMNVDGMFQFQGDPLSTGTAMDVALSNRITPLGVIIDQAGNVHYLKIHEDFTNVTDITQFDRARIAFLHSTTLTNVHRQQFGGKRYFAQGGAGVSDVSDRLYITLMSDSGYSYTYKVAHNKIGLSSTHRTSNAAIFSSDDNFHIAIPFGGVSAPIDFVNSEVDYMLWMVATKKAIDLVREKTSNVSVRSTTEFMLKDGLNPIAVIDMVAHSLKNQSYITNQSYQLNTPGSTMADALELYLQDIPDYILQAYMLSYEDLENGMDSFLELADVDDLRDRRDRMVSGIITADSPEFDETFKDYSTKKGKDAAQAQAARESFGGPVKHDAVDYYTKVKFASDCVHGNISVDALGDGLFNDMGLKSSVIIECILSTIYAEYGNEPSMDAVNAIMEIEELNLIDIHRIIRKREGAFTGYKVDFAKFRERRACMDTWVWAYCTKVFREISNAPVSEQRPYLMELVILENGASRDKVAKYDATLRSTLTQFVVESINKAGFDEVPYGTDGNEMSNWTDKVSALKSADYIAAQLFFFIYGGGCKTPADENGIYHVSMPFRDDIEITVDVPTQLYDLIKQFDRWGHTRYMTVYDFCKYEYNGRTDLGTFNMCLVNADVDPWHVKPKKGYSIKSYSLLPNYYDATSLDNANGEGFYVTAVDNKEIVVNNPLKDMYKYWFLPTPATAEEVMFAENEVKTFTTPEDYYYYMDSAMQEFIFIYVKRWAAEKKKAREMGKKLISIPLKQDIVYAPLASMYCETIPETEPVYTDAEEFNDVQFRSVTDVAKLTWRTFAERTIGIGVSTVAVRPFSIDDLEGCIGVAVSAGILDGSYVNAVPVVVTSNYITVADGSETKVLITRLTPMQMDDFASNGILLKLTADRYFVKAVNGDFVLEVIE